MAQAWPVLSVSRLQANAPTGQFMRLSNLLVNERHSARTMARTLSCSRARRRPGQHQQCSSRRPRSSGRSGSRCRARPRLHWGRSARPAMRRPYALAATLDVTLADKWHLSRAEGERQACSMPAICQDTCMVCLMWQVIRLARLTQGSAKSKPPALPPRCAPRSVRHRSQARTRTRRRRRTRRGRSTRLRRSALGLRMPPPEPSSAVRTWAALRSKPRAVQALQCRR